MTTEPNPTVRTVTALLVVALTLFTAVWLSGLPGTAGAVTPGTEVAAGRPARPGELPFVVGLLDRSEPNRYQAQFCGGSLVAPDRVLTAAHCVHGESPATVDVLVGTLRLEAGPGARIGVRAIRRHPGYSNRTLANDVAVLVLDQPVRGIRPVAIDPGNRLLTRPGRAGTVAGWGRLGERGDFPVALQVAGVPLVGDRACRSAYRAEFLARVMLCAGIGGQDSCGGDSGGPLVVRARGRHVQVGIVSWGYECGSARHPGVYAEVAAVRGWITRAIG